jgi:hypothetical protein
MKRIAAKHNPFGAAGLIGFAEITIGDEDGDVINVGVQFQGPDGQELQERAHVHAYLSDDEFGDTVAGTAPDTVAIGTDGLCVELVADKYFAITTEDDGTFDLNIGENGTDTWYLVIVLPDGSLLVSDAITF